MRVNKTGFLFAVQWPAKSPGHKLLGKRVNLFLALRVTRPALHQFIEVGGDIIS